MTTRFLARDGGRIAYDDTGGSGPLVLCGPGMGDVRSGYRVVTVVTMDVRGHGESSTGWRDHSPEAVGEDMIALLRELDGGPAVIVGLSFTPASAVWAAAGAPDLVAGIVLIAPWISEVRLSPFLRALSQLIVSSPLLWTYAFYHSLYPTTKPADFAEYRRALRRNLAEPGRMAALRAMAAASKAGANARLAELTCPVLVIMGSKDPDFPAPEAEARLAAERAPDGTVVMIEGAGPYPPAEFPDQTAEALVPLNRVLGGHRAR